MFKSYNPVSASMNLPPLIDYDLDYYFHWQVIEINDLESWLLSLVDAPRRKIFRDSTKRWHTLVTVNLQQLEISGAFSKITLLRCCWLITMLQLNPSY
jgi:hypothetical protein